MKRLVSGLLAISLIICFSVTVSAENRSFNDLSKSHWAYNDIMRLVNEGIIQGYDDGTVHPDRPIKRLEAAVLLCKPIACFYSSIILLLIALIKQSFMMLQLLLRWPLDRTCCCTFRI